MLYERITEDINYQKYKCYICDCMQWEDEGSWERDPYLFFCSLKCHEYFIEQVGKMTKNEAAVWASNNGSIHRGKDFTLPSEILQETDLEIIRVFLRDYYHALDAGEVTIFEAYRPLALDIQNLWTKFGIRTDVTMPLFEDTGIRNVVRPLTLTDSIKMSQILYSVNLDLKWIL